MAIVETVNSETGAGHTESAIWTHYVPGHFQTLGVGVAVFPAGLPIPGTDAITKEAVIAEIETTEDGFILRAATLGDESFGVDFRSAALEFLTSMVDRLQVLRRLDGQLSPSDQAVLYRLASVVDVSANVVGT